MFDPEWGIGSSWELGGCGELFDYPTLARTSGLVTLELVWRSPLMPTISNRFEVTVSSAKAIIVSTTNEALEILLCLLT